MSKRHRNFTAQRKLRQLDDEPKKNSQNIQFQDFESFFEPADIKAIRSVRSGREKDSTFVLKVSRGLYKTDTQKLFERSSTGKRQKGIQKKVITPQKKQVIEEMFRERIISELQNEIDYEGELEGRKSKLNRLIGKAIDNIKKQCKKCAEKKNTEVCLTDTHSIARDHQNQISQSTQDHQQTSFPQINLVQTAVHQRNSSQYTPAQYQYQYQYASPQYQYGSTHFQLPPATLCTTRYNTNSIFGLSDQFILHFHIIHKAFRSIFGLHELNRQLSS